MNTKRIALIGLFLGLLGTSLSSFSDDIDIYSDITAAGDLPNVLIIVDSSSNFNSSAPACSYTDSAATPGYNNKAGGIEQCALNNVIQGLPVGTVNIGIMIYNANSLNAKFPSCNSSGNGGCLLVPLTKMDAAGKTSILATVKSWGTSTSTQIDSSGESDASTMQEAWAYYAGKTGMSGTTYTSPAVGGCQKNFVIFISNAFGASASPGEGAGAAPGANLTTTVTSNTALSAAQKSIFTSTIQIPSGVYGTSSFNCPSSYSMGTHSESSGLYLDEWSRYMYGTDLSSGASPATKNITSYTIGVLGTSCKPDWPALLKSTADNGGGKYFATSNYNDVAQAILQILNEVQAVNSVFSSSSLPVSVNTQGTYLNQIYMGMFRPDGSGNPRWLGNLKQYQFKLDSTTQTLFLADATGKQAISSAGTGFISSNAASFWTCTNTSSLTTNPFVQPSNTLYDTKLAGLPACYNNKDPLNGFWKNNSVYVINSAGMAWDLVDGEVVEKGGAAQMLRNLNMTDDYTTAAGTSTNPRNLYTYCPSGTGCIANLTDASNAFATSNTNITASMFGAGGSIAVQSITRSGNVATVTTIGSNGLVAGNSVTISGATPSDYNGTKTVLSAGGNTFTFTVTEYPPVTATTTPVSYVASLQSLTPVAVNSITRNIAGISNTATATATISGGHSLTGGATVAGATPTAYNGNVTFLSTTATTFTYTVPVYPTTPATTPLNYTVQLSNKGAIIVSSLTCASSTKLVTVTTASAHGFHSGDYVTIAGDAQTPSTKQANGSFNIAVTSTTQFTYTVAGCPGNTSAAGITATPGPTTAQALTGLTRNETAVGSGTATATIATGNLFANGDIVTIANASAPSTETAYVLSNATISCSAPCTTFTYAITTTPGAASGTITAAPLSTLLDVTVLGRTGTTASATISAGTFINGSIVNVNVKGGTTPPPTESAYTGTWTITCVGASPCSSFTYAALSLTPVSPATGSITAFSAAASVDKNTLINWVRGEDNYGDEASLCPPTTTTGTNNCPATRVTVRPSVHGDVLHSRPITVNYGGSTGVMVYYASNDGVYHGVNGNQHTFVNSATGATITDNNAGNELWGFVAPDFFAKLPRQRSNLPMLLLPTTPPGITPTPQKKDYFADGPTGLYQYINADTSTAAAYLYLGMRRGGSLLYALDATTPSAPKFMWKITSATAGFNELGQTWSLPRVAMVKGYANPVVIFGGGYDDGAEDAEPPTADTQGRAIYIVDYLTGALVWRASPAVPTTTCTTTQCKIQVAAMTYSIPSDIALLDRDYDGKIDRLYATDVGGNVWRVDLEPTAGNTPDKWQITKLAALGCNTGTCASGTTPRKFFFPPEVISATSSNNYDAVIVGSGDREHPLMSQASYNVVNRLYMLQDRVTGKDALSQTTITEQAGTTSNLYDCTTNCTSTTPYAGQLFGYYITLGTGEKSVNAPLAVAGYAYAGTNQPTVSNNLTCTTNLGIARGYQLYPFGGYANSTTFAGGGLPPSPVAGVVNIVGDDGVTRQVPFLIGAGNPKCVGVGCNSALGAQKPPITVSTKRNRNYWYLEGK